MRILVSTFGAGDAEKVLDAMRALSYDRLVVLGGRGAETEPDFGRISALEAASGEELEFVEISSTGFLDLVDDVTEALIRLSRGPDGVRNDINLNVSGGSKLLGNAALFAAFRLGIEAYHCDGKAVRLPVLTGATSTDRFTSGQLRMVEVLDSPKTLAQASDGMKPMGRQGVERVVRELRKAGLVESSVDAGKVMIFLTPAGKEVLRAVQIGRQTPADQSGSASSPPSKANWTAE